MKSELFFSIFFFMGLTYNSNYPTIPPHTAPENYQKRGNNVQLTKSPHLKSWEEAVGGRS